MSSGLSYCGTATASAKEAAKASDLVGSIVEAVDVERYGTEEITMIVE